MSDLYPTGMWAGSSISVSVRMNHEAYVRRTGNEFLADPMEVHKLTRELVRRLQIAVTPQLSSGEVTQANYAGLMIYAMEHYGWSFEYVARITDVPLARGLADLSGDPRLGVAARRLGVRARLVELPPLWQCVRLAEILASGTKLLKKRATPEWLKDATNVGVHNEFCNNNAHELMQWAEHASLMLEGMKGRTGLFKKIRYEQAIRFAQTLRNADNVIRELHEFSRVRKGHRVVARPEVAVEATADVPAVEDAAAGLAAASA